MKTAVAAIALMLAGCTTFNRPPTLTQVTDGALKCYSTAFKSGAVSSDLAVKVSVEYLNYRQAARIARDAKTKDSATWTQAFEIAKHEATAFVMLIVPLCAVHDSISLQNGLKLATEI